MRKSQVTVGAVITAMIGLLLNYFLWFAAEDEVIRDESVETPFMASPEYSEGMASSANNADAITISRVVDGDTIKVLISGEEETIRMIGINTPETVDPRKSVECFGQEASSATKEMLDVGEVVTLTADPTQDDRDKYGRLLRYVADESGQDVGLRLISQGYAYEYTYRVPYERQAAYEEAQQTARELGVGLWDDTICP